MNISIAKPDDAPKILEVQKRAFAIEAQRYNNFSIRPIIETVDQYRMFFDMHTVLIIHQNEAIIGSVSVRLENGTTYLNRLIVEPSFHGKGFASRLIDAAVGYFPNCSRVELFTGCESFHNQAIYVHKGFTEFRRAELDGIEMIYMEKVIVR